MEGDRDRCRCGLDPTGQGNVSPTSRKLLRTADVPVIAVPAPSSRSAVARVSHRGANRAEIGTLRSPPQACGGEHPRRRAPNTRPCSTSSAAKDAPEQGARLHQPSAHDGLRSDPRRAPSYPRKPPASHATPSAQAHRSYPGASSGQTANARGVLERQKGHVVSKVCNDCACNRVYWFRGH